MADHPQTIVMDFDDTLVGYRRFGSDGEWLLGAQDALRGLLGEGYAVTVASCRVTWDDGLAVIFAKLREAGFEPDLVIDDSMVSLRHPAFEDVSAPVRVSLKSPPAGHLGVWFGVGKPMGVVYVDDRSAEFTNDWESIVELIHEQAPPR